MFIYSLLMLFLATALPITAQNIRRPCGGGNSACYCDSTLMQCDRLPTLMETRKDIEYIYFNHPITACANLTELFQWLPALRSVDFAHRQMVKKECVKFGWDGGANKIHVKNWAISDLQQQHADTKAQDIAYSVATVADSCVNGGCVIPLPTWQYLCTIVENNICNCLAMICTIYLTFLLVEHIAKLIKGNELTTTRAISDVYTAPPAYGAVVASHANELRPNNPTPPSMQDALADDEMAGTTPSPPIKEEEKGDDDDVDDDDDDDDGFGPPTRILGDFNKFRRQSGAFRTPRNRYGRCSRVNRLPHVAFIYKANHN